MYNLRLANSHPVITSHLSHSLTPYTLYYKLFNIRIVYNTLTYSEKSRWMSHVGMCCPDDLEHRFNLRGSFCIVAALSASAHILCVKFEWILCLEADRIEHTPSERGREIESEHREYVRREKRIHSTEDSLTSTFANTHAYRYGIWWGFPLSPSHLSLKRL